MGKVSDVLIEAQEFVLEYMTENGEMICTEVELYQHAHEHQGIFFADCVKQEYKDMQEGW